ncbi:NAD(P)H-binding protein [Fibrella sp. HMF5036]|uniref:NAD(P)H-binding protein n=2 Tax=Fibrella aquatilis TaxID=2817059 RepID=A0A939GAS6_9BACT|nr:NAD(P)H-binding protein [Fibrella aquatilis]
MAQDITKTLVLGGTGKTGSRIVQQLIDRDVAVRIGSRFADIPFDWLDQSTWVPVLQDVKAVYIAYQPDLAVPGAVDAIRDFTQLAVKNGVQQLVMLSGRGEPEAQDCERVVRQSGVDWTILRASWFCQNFSEGYLLEPILAGYVALPVADIGEPFIDIDDLADVAVTALTQPGHSGKVYELTGLRLLTFAEAIGEIARAAGRSIQYEQVPIETYTATLTEYGVPEEAIALMTYLFTEVMDGRNSTLTNGVEEALGRKPTDFSDFVQKSIALGIWAETPGGEEAGATRSPEIEPRQ